VLDAHVHVWDPAELRYSLFAGRDALQRRNLIGDYLYAAAPLGVRRAICVGAASAGGDGRQEAEWLVHHVADEGRVAGVIAWAPLDQPELADRLEWLRRIGGASVVGVRRSFEFEPPGFARSRGVAAGARLAGELGFVVDLVLFARSLPAAADLVHACPDTQFVLDHLGKPPIAAGGWQPWADDIAALAGFPNVSVKLSGLANEAAAGWSPATLTRYVEHAVDCFGFERMMLGSDWPMVELAGGLSSWLRAVDELLSTASPDERAAVLERTAARVYGV
jgi:L-fuconolactonase